MLSFLLSVFRCLLLAAIFLPFLAFAGDGVPKGVMLDDEMLTSPSTLGISIISVDSER